MTQAMLAEAAEAPGGIGGYVVEEQAGFLLRRAHQRHTALFAELMTSFDLTPTQFTALVKIVGLGRVTQNLLGRLVAVDPATIQGVVRRLIGRGLVARRLDPMDRRMAVLVPTDEGRRLAAGAAEAARSITEATLAPLDEAERRHLLSLLRKLG